MKFFVVLALSFFSVSALSCEFAEPIACKRPSLALHKKSFAQLKQRLKSYGTMLEKLSGKPKRQMRCSKANEIDYQIKFIEKYAKKNNNYHCEEHVKVLVLQSETLIDLASDDHKRIKSKKAKLQLIDSAMDVSEALVYYKNKHPLF